MPTLEQITQEVLNLAATHFHNSPRALLLPRMTSSRNSASTACKPWNSSSPHRKSLQHRTPRTTKSRASATSNPSRAHPVPPVKGKICHRVHERREEKMTDLQREARHRAREFCVSGIEKRRTHGPAIGRASPQVLAPKRQQTRSPDKL